MTDVYNNVIYMIENQINRKKYIGKTDDPLSRKKSHFSNSHNIYLRRSIKKYGIKSFSFELLAENVSDLDIDDLEIFYIKHFDSFNNGYNLTEGGEGGNTLKDPVIAKKHAENTSKGMIGITRNFSKQHRKWLSNNIKTKATPQATIKNSKPCLVEGIYFSSQHEASRKLNISQPLINYRLKTNKSGYKYLMKKEN